MTPDGDFVFRFKIALQGIEPEIWRVIGVPASYDFWDLHVANQGAMGWLDCHLHVFRPVGSWLHRITLVDILSAQAPTTYPRYVGGARASPPED